MTSLFARRVAACIVSAAALAAVAPAASSAYTTDRYGRCEGVSIDGWGSTFQNPVQKVWEGQVAGKGFNVNRKAGCTAAGAPTATYVQKETPVKTKGSGACLKALGAEGQVKNTTVDFCGTDEAPNPTQKKEIEEELTGTSLGSSPFLANPEEEGWLETIPVIQGAVAVIVHLPEGCTASSPAAAHRLSLDGKTVGDVYRGLITTWKGLLATQTDGSNSISCAGTTESKAGAIIKYEEGGVVKEVAEGTDATAAQEEEEIITPVVRHDHSGTTHIFKAYLAQVDPGTFEGEGAYNECSGGTKGVGVPGGETWYTTSTGCENQRWPAAHSVAAPNYGGIFRPAEEGNPGVVNTVGTKQSSLGYADLAVAREFYYFSATCTAHPTACGGENGEPTGKPRFWAVLENSASKHTYKDPSTDGDVEAPASSNCKKAEYINTATNKPFPPATTRDLWNGATALAETKKAYGICGLTYDLAFKYYMPFFGETAEPAAIEEGKKLATTVENYLSYEINKKGGAKEDKGVDYEALPSSILVKDLAGIEEIGYKVSHP